MAKTAEVLEEKKRELDERTQQVVAHEEALSKCTLEARQEVEAQAAQLDRQSQALQLVCFDHV